MIINYATITAILNVKKNLYVICCCRGSYIHRTMNSWLYPHTQVKSTLNCVQSNHTPKCVKRRPTETKAVKFDRNRLQIPQWQKSKSLRIPMHKTHSNRTFMTIFVAQGKQWTRRSCDLGTCKIHCTKVVNSPMTTYQTEQSYSVLLI